MRLVRLATRGLSTLREPLVNLPAGQAAPTIDTGVKRSTTANGVDVVTVDANSSYSAAVVAFRAGSRYEDATTSGAATHLARMMYMANASGKTNVAVTRDLLLSTADSSAHSTREMLTYGAEFVRDEAANVITQLGAIAQPLLRGWEVEDTREFAEEDSEIDLETHMLNNAMWVAYRGQPLGRAPHPQDVSTTPESLQAFAKSRLTRANAVVVGVGVEHNSFLKATEAAFAKLPEGRKAEGEKSKYIGGESHTESSDDPMVVLGFKGGAFGTREYFAHGVLGHVLGCTPARFDTKARPGHGLASRLNRRLSGEAGVISAEAVQLNFSDGGLFALVLQTLQGEERAVAEMAAAELSALAKTPLSAAELSGAKLKLKFSILDDYESVADRAYFYAKQALYGPVLCRSTFVAQIDALSAADIQSAAAKLFESPLTLVTEGRTSNVGLGDIRANF